MPDCTFIFQSELNLYSSGSNIYCETAKTVDNWIRGIGFDRFRGYPSICSLSFWSNNRKFKPYFDILTIYQSKSNTGANQESLKSKITSSLMDTLSIF